MRAWIDQGAVWPAGGVAAAVVRPKSSHWSLQPIQRPALPAVRNAAWVRNPIDAFILARLESEKIAPSPEADKNTLLRRLSLDLTGLPPTPAEVAAFLADTRPDAYERVVDRLMASPHYGEKWARHWLDQARYADSDGYEKDSRRPHAWRYREWVIDAFNRDMPFDQFTIEQIAGDLLPGATIDQRVATGFHRNTLTNREGGVNINQFRFEQLVDRAAAVGTVWLGLTVGCAQCHDHKYDPISQKDFYQMFAFFNNAEEVNIEAPMDGRAGPVPARAQRLLSRAPQIAGRVQSHRNRAGVGAQDDRGRRHSRQMDRSRRGFRHGAEDGGWRRKDSAHAAGAAHAPPAGRHHRSSGPLVLASFGRGEIQRAEVQGAAEKAGGPGSCVPGFEPGADDRREPGAPADLFARPRRLADERRRGSSEHTGGAAAAGGDGRGQPA